MPLAEQWGASRRCLFAGGLLMTRAPWMIAACMLSLSPLAQAQEFPTPTNMPGQPRYAQAPAPVAPVLQPQPPLPPRVAHERAPVVAASMSELTPTPEM